MCFALLDLFSISSILIQTGSQVQAIIERNKEEVLTDAIPITARRRQFTWEVLGEAGTDKVLSFFTKVKYEMNIFNRDSLRKR